MSGDGDEIFAGVGKGVLGLLLTIPLIAVLTVVDGFVTATLWQWFAVPIFWARSLTIAEAIGIAMVVRQLRGPSYTKQRGINWRLVVIGPWLTLLIGWIVKHWI